MDLDSNSSLFDKNESFISVSELDITGSGGCASLDEERHQNE